MRRLWGLLGVASLIFSISVAQEEQPLINYAGGYGSFDYDFFVGNPSVGLVRDGRAEGFIIDAPADFQFTLDEEDKVAGLASQKVTFNRNASNNIEALITRELRFPSQDYPQPGETIRIRLWLKTSNWNNATVRVRARGLNDSNRVILYSTMTPPTEWTELDMNYVVPSSPQPGIFVEISVISWSGVSSGTLWVDELIVTGSKRWRPHAPRSLKIIAPYYPWAEENQQDWVYYAREFDAIIANWPDIKQLRTHRPDLLNVLYYNLVYSSDSGPNSWHVRDIFGYRYCDAYHPDWFLLNVFGQRQRFGSYTYLMDIGNRSTSQWAAQNLSQYMLYSEPNRDVIHFDSFSDFFTNAFHLQKYPTPASRIAAMGKHLLNLRAATQDRNILFIINAAEAPYTRDLPHTYFLRQGLIDGILIEQAFTHIFSLPTGFVGFSRWQGQLTSLVENAPRLRVVYSGYGVSNPVEGRRQKIFALASFLLCADPNIYLYLDKHYHDAPPARQRSWRPDADFDVPLGQPTAPHEIFYRSSDYPGGLYYRSFENGFVLVNPTGNIAPSWKDGAVFSWVLDADYWELWSGQTFRAGTVIKLYPKQARIFVRASSAALHDYPPAKGKLLPQTGGSVSPPPGKPTLRR